MTVIAGYWLFLLSSCAIMFCFGGRAERQFVGLVIVATFATIAAIVKLGMTAALPFVATIDGALWGVSLLYVVRLDRYWPVWFAGFHLNSLATEVGAIIFPGAFATLNANLAGAWALPALGFAAIGVLKDQAKFSSLR